MGDAQKLSYHAAADIFPLLEGAEFAELVDDIKANGQLKPIILHPDGSIMDGRNRYRACLEAGIGPVFQTWELGDDQDPFDVVLSLNLYRRHLTSSQKACVAAEILPHFEARAKERERIRKSKPRTPAEPAAEGADIEATPEDSPESKPKPLGKRESREIVARMVGTNSSYVSSAKKMRTENPEVFAKVQSGELNIEVAKQRIADEKRERKWKADQRKRNREHKKRMDNRPDPEEAKKQARAKGVSVWASDGEWYDGLTDEERTEKEREREVAYQTQQLAHALDWNLRTYANFSGDVARVVERVYEFNQPDDVREIIKEVPRAIEVLKDLRDAFANSPPPAEEAEDTPGEEEPTE